MCSHSNYPGQTNHAAIMTVVCMQVKFMIVDNYFISNANSGKMWLYGGRGGSIIEESDKASWIKSDAWFKPASLFTFLYTASALPCSELATTPPALVHIVPQLSCIFNMR